VLRRIEATSFPPWLGSIGLATAAGFACFLVARFSLALAPEPNLVSELFAVSVSALVLAVLFAKRQSYEAALKDRNEQLQLALDAAELGVWGYDLMTGRFECDPRDRQINGHDPAAPPKTLAEAQALIHPDDLGNLDKLFKASARTGRSYRAEYRLATVVGRQERWVEVEGTVMRAADGRPTRLLGITRDITDRKLAERKLKESEREFRDLLGTLPAAVYVTDAAGRITYYNAAAAALWGVKPELGKTEFCGSWKLCWPDGTPLQHDECPMALALRERRSIRGMEAVVERPDGTRVPFIPYPAPLFDTSGKLTGAVNMLVDISERKRAEADLAERQAQLALFVEHAPAAIAMFDREMRYLAVSRRFLIEFRLPPDTQLIGKSHYEVFPEVPQRWRDIHACVLAGEALSNDEDQFTRQDGRTEWTGWSMAPWREGDGRIGGAVLFAEVRTAQVEARRALADSEARFRATFENAAVGVALVSSDGPILRANSSVARMLGYSVEELTTKTFQDLTYPDDLPGTLSLVNKALVGEAESYSIEKRYVRKDGGIMWASLTVGCVRQTDGGVDYFVSVIQDITERKRAEEQQRTLLAELDHRVKNALATVSAVISHTQQEIGSVADFAEALDGRIRSMATTHELLSSHRWQGVSLSELVRRELEPYAGANTEIGGPFVGLQPEAAQAVAMVLHELATNAAKHGVFSKRRGRVLLRWWWQPNGSHDRLAIEWKEVGGPPVAAPSRQSYGTAIIREVIPFELGGAANLTFAFDGIECRLEIPGRWVSWGSQLSDDTQKLLSTEQSTAT
jgi:PAS domain S-box-containing protein